MITCSAGKLSHLACFHGGSTKFVQGVYRFGRYKSRRYTLLLLKDL